MESNRTPWLRLATRRASPDRQVPPPPLRRSGLPVPRPFQPPPPPAPPPTPPPPPPPPVVEPNRQAQPESSPIQVPSLAQPILIPLQPQSQIGPSTGVISPTPPQSPKPNKNSRGPDPDPIPDSVTDETVLVRGGQKTGSVLSSPRTSTLPPKFEPINGQSPSLGRVPVQLKTGSVPSSPRARISPSTQPPKFEENGQAPSRGMVESSTQIYTRTGSVPSSPQIRVPTTPHRKPLSLVRTEDSLSPVPKRIVSVPSTPTVGKPGSQSPRIRLTRLPTPPDSPPRKQSPPTSSNELPQATSSKVLELEPDPVPGSKPEPVAIESRLKPIRVKEKAVHEDIEAETYKPHMNTTLEEESPSPTNAHNGSKIHHPHLSPKEHVPVPSTRPIRERDGQLPRTIYLSGENIGATMEFIDHRYKPRKLHDKATNHMAKEGEQSSRDETEGNGMSQHNTKPVPAIVNSNVQSVNNSVMYDCVCSHNSPGVHLISSIPTRSTMDSTGAHERDWFNEHQFNKIPLASQWSSN